MNNKFIAIVDGVSWDEKNNYIILNGYCCIEGKSQLNNSSVKKSLIIKCGKSEYVVPLKNMERKNIDNFSYEDFLYSGFYGVIDVGYIDNMDSLGFGDWKLSINIRVSDLDLVLDLKNEASLDFVKSKVFLNKKNKSNTEIYPTVKEGVLYLKSVKKNKANYKPSKVSMDVIKKGFKYFVKSMVSAVGYEIYDFYKSKPIKDNSILFLSDSRSDLSGNFEFIYEELKSRGNFDIQQFLKPSIDAKINVFDKFKFLKSIATSKYILVDDYYPKIYNFELREETELIQLWHACGAFKTFGFSRVGKEGGPNARAKTHRNYTKAFVSSNEIRKFYAEGFGISEHKIYDTGVPRTDIFFDDEYKSKKIEELRGKYPKIKNKKVIMFAPTFRGHGQKTAYYDFDKLDINTLYREFGQDYVIIMKLHPFVKDTPIIDDKYRDFILDLSDEREINDLLFISDLLITDYSSVCFEFSLLNRPMIFFSYDMEDYIDKRDFYYPYKEFVPGPIARNTEDIVDIIKNENFELEKLDSFRKRFFSYFDGKSTKRVVDIILNSK